jgi:hypothetical protein
MRQTHGQLVGITSAGRSVFCLLDILRASTGTAEAVGAVFVWGTGLFVIARVLLRLGVLD